MMNERIEKLSHLAWTKTSEAVPFYDSTGNISRDFNFKYVQMFAELIVRECLETIEEMDPHSAMRDIDDIYVVVEKHFGVEQ